MTWDSYINGFQSFLMLEKGLSPHSISAYISDVTRLKDWTIQDGNQQSPLLLEYSDLAKFVESLYSEGLDARSSARIISGVKAFYNYLLVENLLESNPSELLEGPRLRRKIPEVLTIQEIEKLLGAIDMSHPQGHRNRAILEVLYACGLRVSELVNLRLSQYFADLDVIKVIGKNNKERIIPIGRTAQKYLDIYISHNRRQLDRIDPGDADIIFLNRRGRRLSRNMIFLIIKETVKKAGIQKKVSPHTFRHSFATHLIEGGADLKAVQDLLGHESITTTEIYTHLDTHYLRETIRNFHPRSQE